MLIMENFLLALNGIKSNKMRSLLTMLGIIIGIASVIAIISIGNAMSKNLENEMKNWGMQNLSVNVSPRPNENENGEENYDEFFDYSPDKDDMLSLEQLLQFENVFKDDIEAASYEKTANSDAVRIGNKEESVQIVGTNTGYQKIKKIKMLKGRYHNNQDILRSANVVVISKKTAEKIDPKGDVIGKELKITIEDQLRAFTIIGIYEDPQKSGSSFGGYEESISVYVPVTVVGDLTNDMTYNFFEIMPKSEVSNEIVTEKATKYFNEIYKMNEDWYCEIYNAQKDMDQMMGSTATIKFAIAVIAGISLLVGGIGVMNIMLVSVTERTREIGVRKALGAKGASIKLQFIVEAMIICAIGGIIGVMLGLSISLVGVKLLKLPVAISIASIIVSVVFSMAIGIFFGYYPAKKAAKLDPIEALRYE